MKLSSAPLLLLLASGMAQAQPAPANCSDAASARAVADGFEERVNRTNAERSLLERAAQGKAEQAIDQLISAGKLSTAQRDGVVQAWLADRRFKQVDAQKWTEMRLAADAAQQARAFSKKADFKQACTHAEKSIHHFNRFNEHDGALYSVLVDMAREAAGVARKNKPK